MIFSKLHILLISSFLVWTLPAISQVESIYFSLGNVKTQLNQPALGIGANFNLSKKFYLPLEFIYSRENPTNLLDFTGSNLGSGGVGQFNGIPIDSKIGTTLINMEPNGSFERTYFTHHYALNCGISTDIQVFKKAFFSPGIITGIRIDSDQDISLVGQYQYETSTIQTTDFSTFIQIEKRVRAHAIVGLRFPFHYQISKKTRFGACFRGELTIKDNFFRNMTQLELITLIR